LHLSFLLPDPLSQQIGFMCNRVSYKGTNVCDELTSAGLKFPEGDGIVWLCRGDPTLEQVLLKSNGLINRAPETLMLKSVVILTMKHQSSSIHTSQKVSFGAHWLWRNSEKLLLWSETISCNVQNLFGGMSWPQCDVGSMESQNSDQCGCYKQGSRHSESILVTKLPCALARELQEGDQLPYLLVGCAR